MPAITPRLSIITVNLNNLEGLKQTMQSVFEQTFTDYEYIIIDGGSSDGSKEYIEQHADRLAYWVSEKDGGVYQAMNKGVLKATGEYLLFLNSGDDYHQTNSVQILTDFAQGNDLVYGNIIVIENDRFWEKTYPPELTFKYFLKDTLPHPATLIRKELLLRAGMFNEEAKIVSDWEFFIYAIGNLNAKYRHVNCPVTNFHFDGISSLKSNQDLIFQEKENVLKNRYAAFIPDYKEAEIAQRKLESILNSRWLKLRNQLKRFGI